MPFTRRRPCAVGEFLERLGDDRKAVIIEPVDQRAQGREFLILGHRRIIERAHQHALAREKFQQALVVDVEGKSLGRAIEIGAIDKEGELFLGVEQHGNAS